MKIVNSTCNNSCKTVRFTALSGSLSLLRARLYTLLLAKSEKIWMNTKLEIQRLFLNFVQQMFIVFIYMLFRMHSQKCFNQPIGLVKTFLRVSVLFLYSFLNLSSLSLFLFTFFFLVTLSHVFFLLLLLSSFLS